MALMLEKLKEDKITVTKLISSENSVPQSEKNYLWYSNAQVSYEAYGKPQQVLRLFEYVDTSIGKLERNHVVVKVEASTVSMTDCLQRNNMYPKSVRFPFTPGCVLVGKVVQCDDVARKYSIKEDDLVATIGIQLGGNSKYVAVPCERLIKVPEGLHAADVACVMITYVAAYQCLHRAGNRPIRATDKILVTGGNGCVAKAIIDLARVSGAHKVYATANEKHRKVVENCGATFVSLDAKNEGMYNPNVEEEMDIVIDSVCADGFGWGAPRRALKSRGGKLVCIGTTANLAKQTELAWLCGTPLCSHWNRTKMSYRFMSHASFYDVFDSMSTNPLEFRRDVAYIFKLLREGSIKPQISFEISLAGVAAAHEQIENGGVNGHIVCFPFAEMEKQIKVAKAVKPFVAQKPKVQTKESEDFDSDVLDVKKEIQMIIQSLTGVETTSSLEKH